VKNHCEPPKAAKDVQSKVVFFSSTSSHLLGRKLLFFKKVGASEGIVILVPFFGSLWSSGNGQFSNRESNSFPPQHQPEDEIFAFKSFPA